MAATVIQQAWRRFIVRRSTKEKTASLEAVLNMTLPSWKSNEMLKCSLIYFEENSDFHPQALKSFKDLEKSEEEKVWDRRGASLLEDIEDEIREWMLLWFNELGFFDYLPYEKDGGSALLVMGVVRTPEEYISEKYTVKEKKISSAKLEDLSFDKNQEENEDWEPNESKIMPYLMAVNDEFETKWSYLTDQIVDPKGGLIIEKVRDELYYNMQKKVRPIADTNMRPLLEKLNTALVLDHAEGDVGFELPTRQIFAESGNGVPQQRKKIELFADVSPEEFLTQLMRWKVIRNCPECSLDDWPGVDTYAYHRAQGTQLGDIKQPIVDYCILPVASKFVSQLAPFVRSVCICGPPKNGQLFIAHAICTELKATVFDLTPEKHVGRFLGRDTQDKLVKAILKVAKAYPPSVVLVESESAWLKKIPPELRRVNPARFVSIYKRIIKGVKPGDQVIVI